jgi:hypothetical protein
MIDENLRKVYDSVLKEDVPDRFTSLISQLREASAQKPAETPKVEAGGDE